MPPSRDFRKKIQSKKQEESTQKSDNKFHQKSKSNISKSFSSSNFAAFPNEWKKQARR
jgi:hypothetical protein